MDTNFQALIHITGHEVLALAEARKALQRIAEDADLSEELSAVGDLLGSVISRARASEASCLYTAIDRLSEDAMPEEWEVIQQAAMDGELMVNPEFMGEYDDIVETVMSTKDPSVQLDNELADKLSDDLRWTLNAQIRRQLHYTPCDDALAKAGLAGRDEEYGHSPSP